MIAFGTAVTSPDVYRECAERGIRLAAEPDSAVRALDSPGSIFAAYNALLDWAQTLDGLEALVLVHQDAEIVDADFCARIRQALRDPDVGVVGCVGAVGVRSIAWWEGSVSLASFTQRYSDHGGGDLPAFSWAWGDAPPYARVGEVDTVDGFLMALSPWVVGHVRFDESLGRLHGYDLDVCLQVREAGRKVVTADFRAIHNHSLELIGDRDGWVDAHVRVADKWAGRIGQIGDGPGSWQERALRAEAERDATRLADHTNRLRFEARMRELEATLAETTDSLSWRITAPLRRLMR